MPVELVDVTLLRLTLGSVFGVMGFLGRAVERFIVTKCDDSLSCFGVDGSLERPTGFRVTGCSVNAVDIAIVFRLFILFCRVFIFRDIVVFLVEGSSLN